MSKRIVYTFQAKQDLEGIYEYIAYALCVPDTAHRIYQEIIQCVRSLKSMPERYPLYQEEPWHSQGVRFVPVKSYLVFYVVNSQKNIVSILRILYAGMNLRRHLKESFSPDVPH